MSLPDDLSAEVLVIGSGAGGAPTAALLAESGLDVLVIEEGDWVAQDVVVPFSLEQMSRQYRSRGLTVALGRPSIAYTEGCCAGGGSEVNSGLYWRPPASLLERWRDQYGLTTLDPDEIDAILDEIETALSVQLLPGRATEPSEVLRRGAEALGWRHGEVPRWMTYPDATATTGRRQSMTETYLPRARDAGARIVTGCRAERIEIDRDVATGVIVRDTVGTRRTIRCRHVVVCGGAIQTPALLQRSGIRRNIGSSLAIHPTVKLAARFGAALNVPDDVPVHQVKEFAPLLSFGGSASHPGLVALALADAWETFGARVVDWERMSVYYAAITAQGTGRVRALPGFADPLVTYRLTRRDRGLLGRGLARLALLVLEAGADEVYPSFRSAPIVRSRADVALQQRRFSATRATVMTVHLCSTVPLGGRHDTRRGTDEHGAIPGVANVAVNDASLLPDAPGVNPQATVMALAIRNVRHHLAADRYARVTPS